MLLLDYIFIRIALSISLSILNQVQEVNWKSRLSIKNI